MSFLALTSCAGGIGLRRTQVLTGLFNNDLEELYRKFQEIRPRMTRKEVEDLGFSVVRGVVVLKGSDAQPEVFGRGNTFQVPADKTKADEFAQHLNSFFVWIIPFQDVRVAGRVGFINWQELNSGEDRRLIIKFYRDADGVDRVFDTAESQGDPVGVKTREAADFIIGGAGSAVSGAGSELGRDAIRTYSPFR